MFETGATFKDYYRITKTMNISKTYSPFGLDYMYIFFSKVTSNCQILEVHTHSVHVCNVKTKRTILLLSRTYMFLCGSKCRVLFHTTIHIFLSLKYVFCVTIISKKHPISFTVVLVSLQKDNKGTISAFKVVINFTARDWGKFQDQHLLSTLDGVCSCTVDVY